MFTNIQPIFKPFIDYLFKFKKDGVIEIKKYINALWGALCQKNDLHVTLDKTFDTDNILMIMPNYNNLEFRNDAKSFNAVVAKKEKRYETNWARMEPFIVASGRLKISNMILPNIENVVRCHTDGIILKKPIVNVKLGSDIGDLKLTTDF